MNKKEILSKSRQQIEDEGTIYADNKGRRYGYIGFGAVFIFIILFNLFTKQDTLLPWCMYSAYSAAESYGRYRATKAKSMMALTVLGVIAFVLVLTAYVSDVLGIVWWTIN